MIVSASRRTDIPAFYADWLINRLREGFALVRNPFNHDQVARVDLSPAAVEGIVFWTKDPANLMTRLDEIDRMGHRYYFLFTLTPYDRGLEPGLRGKDAILRTFNDLAGRIGPERVIWRYDPIVLTDRYTEEEHVRLFARLARELRGRTEKCVISFIHMYKKCERNLKGISLEPLTPEAMRRLAGRLAPIAADNGMAIESCAVTLPLEDLGIRPGRCIDAALISRLAGRTVAAAKDRHQRPACDCAASLDIGAYDTCTHGCRYCYANSSPAAAERNRRLHDPASPLLFGSPRRRKTIPASAALADREAAAERNIRRAQA